MKDALAFLSGGGRAERMIQARDWSVHLRARRRTGQMSIEGPQADALDVLGKPYRRSELLARVQAALRNGARTGQGRMGSDFGAARI